MLYGITHWGRVTHICVSKLKSIDSDNGLSPGRHQAIVWTNAGILLIWPLGTNFREMLIEIHKFSFLNEFEYVIWKMAAILSRPQCDNGALSTLVQMMVACIHYLNHCWLIIIRALWPWYRLCEIVSSYTFMKKYFNNLYHFSVGESYEMQIHRD